MKIRGFTLIELMITLVIISILSIVVVSRFDGKSSYVEYTYQGRLISLARQLQIRAMHHTQATGYCYQVNIATGSTPWFSSPNVDSPPSNTNCASNTQWQPSDNDLATATNQSEMADEGLAIVLQDNQGDDMEVSNLSLQFNTLGQIYYLSTGVDLNSQCQSGCKLIIRGQADAAVCLQGQGYIHGC